MASIEAHNYGIIATPLTVMLRKNYLHWTAVAVTAFGELKKVMTTISILTLPDFDQLFVHEGIYRDGRQPALLPAPKKFNDHVLPEGSSFGVLNNEVNSANNFCS